MTKKVMIVEDNELNLKLFTDLLAAHKFIVEGVKDGRLALEQARMFEPDLIIMDIQLPHISGLGSDSGDAERWRALAAIPVLAVTAYAGKGDEDRTHGCRCARLSFKAGIGDEVSRSGERDIGVR